MMPLKYNVVWLRCSLRYEHQSQSALTLIELAKTANSTLYKSYILLIELSAGHQYWKEICTEQGQSAGLVSVMFDAKYDLEDIRAFCDALKLFKLGFSWGGPVSLVMLYNLKDMRVLEHSHIQTQVYWFVSV